jgi:hypothetical protein
MHQHLIVASLIALGTACGGGLSTDLEGVYSVDTWTQNATGCGAGGDDVTSLHDPLIYVKADSFFGADFIGAVGCPDPATCQAEAADDTISLGQFYFEEGSDDEGWIGRGGYSSGPGPDGMCIGGLNVLTMTGSAGASITLRDEFHEAAPFAPEGGECDVDTAMDNAATQPCASADEVHATFTAEL